MAALYDHPGIDAPYAFNRKEAKDHGEGGVIVGHPLQGRVRIIDGVISIGISSVRESVEILQEQRSVPAGVVSPWTVRNGDRTSAHPVPSRSAAGGNGSRLAQRTVADLPSSDDEAS